MGITDEQHDEPDRNGHRDELGVRSVERLDASSRGRWLVTTWGSRHVFDLNDGVYLRLPGAGSSRFPYDETPVKIIRVERWPHVGSTFLIWFDDPEHPERFEHWRQSSTIRQIRRLADDTGV